MLIQYILQRWLCQRRYILLPQRKLAHFTFNIRLFTALSKSLFCTSVCWRKLYQYSCIDPLQSFQLRLSDFLLAPSLWFEPFLIFTRRHSKQCTYRIVSVLLYTHERLLLFLGGSNINYVRAKPRLFSYRKNENSAKYRDLSWFSSRLKSWPIPIHTLKVHFGTHSDSWRVSLSCIVPFIGWANKILKAWQQPLFYTKP